MYIIKFNFNLEEKPQYVCGDSWCSFFTEDKKYAYRFKTYKTAQMNALNIYEDCDEKTTTFEIIEVGELII